MEPAVPVLIECCNLGYARGECDRLPEGSADAIRLSLASADRLLWVIERDHLPVEHGALVPGESTGREDLVDAQIDAYLRAGTD